MIDLLKEIILDFQDFELDTGVPRRCVVTPIKQKATVCIGVRRCGKSTFMYQLIQKLLNEGVDRQNVLYINMTFHTLKRSLIWHTG